MNTVTSDLKQLIENNPQFTTMLMSKVHEYFQDADNRKAFEEWYEKNTARNTYGKRKSKHIFTFHLRNYRKKEYPLADIQE